MSTKPLRSGGRSQGGWRAGNQKMQNWRRAPAKAKTFVMKAQDNDEDVDSPPAPAQPVARLEADHLTPEQRAAADRALAGESLFLTGAAGTGKSFLLRYLVQELEAMHPTRVAVTASTGIAAANIGGQTIHSFSGVGLGKGTPRQLLNFVKKSQSAIKRWQTTRVLVIDEVSMLDSELFEALEVIASFVRREGNAAGNCRARAPFGGLQLILCGDFLQLPPVQGRGEAPKKFCFQSASWVRCGLDKGKVVLTQSVRQASDLEFAAILNEVRLGVVSPAAQSKLAECHVDRKAPPTDGILATKLYCLNRNVDAENNAQLERLSGEYRVFHARESFRGCRNQRDRHMLQEVMERKTPFDLPMKVGAQVILVKNQPAVKLVNGSRGVVDSFVQGFPLVRFDNHVSVRIGLEAHTAQIGTAEITRTQVPLKLGWALTVHKAQGMTLSRAELQLDNAFEAGQVYVALSRLTSLAGLWIRGKGLSGQSTRAHADVLDFYSMPEAGFDPKLAKTLGVEVTSPLLSRLVVKSATAKKQANEESGSNNASPYFQGDVSEVGADKFVSQASPSGPSRDSGPLLPLQRMPESSRSGRRPRSPTNSNAKRRRLKPMLEKLSQDDALQPEQHSKGYNPPARVGPTGNVGVCLSAPLGHPAAPATPSRSHSAPGGARPSVPSAAEDRHDPTLPSWQAATTSKLSEGTSVRALHLSNLPPAAPAAHCSRTLQQVSAYHAPPAATATTMQSSPGGSICFGELPAAAPPPPSRAAIRNGLLWRQPACQQTLRASASECGMGWSQPMAGVVSAKDAGQPVVSGGTGTFEGHTPWIAPPSRWGGVIQLD